jgi:Leucine-rich repeat (LRR) protein
LTKCQKTSRLTSYGYTNDKAQAIPTELRYLTNAKELTIQKVLTGSIPSSLSCLTKLIKLEISSVDDFLTGSIPDSLSRLTKLSSLLLKSQNIKGPIPTSISRMTALTSLSISHTHSPEYIPSSLQYLTNLRSLKLSHGFMGTIPSFLAKLGKLTSLDLGLNQLNGTIPLILSTMTNMISLSLRVNQLEGALPPSLSKLSRLQRLFLDGNKLEGEIPIAILNMSLAEVWLSGNKLTAFIDYYEDFNFCYILNGGRWYVDCGPVECSCCLSASNIECSVGRRLR